MTQPHNEFSEQNQRGHFLDPPTLERTATTPELLNPLYGLCFVFFNSQLNIFPLIFTESGRELVGKAGRERGQEREREEERE